MIGALAMTFRRGPAALSVSIPSTASAICLHLPSQTCTNTITVTATPSGGSGDYVYQWEFVDNPSSFSMSNSDGQTVYVSKTANDQLGITCSVRVLITDNVSGDQAYSNPCTVTSSHESNA